MLDDFLQWSAEQEQKKTAFLPSLRIGGRMQHAASRFLDALQRSLSANDATTDAADADADGVEVAEEEQSQSARSAVSTLAAAAAAAEAGGFQHEALHSAATLAAAAAHFSRFTLASYRDGSLSLGVGPLPQDAHHHRGSLPAALAALPMLDARLHCAAAAVQHAQPALQAQLASFGADLTRAAVQHSDAVARDVLGADIAALSAQLTRDVAPPPLPAGLARRLQMAQREARDEKRREIDAAKQRCGAPRSALDRRRAKRTVKLAHRRANEAAAFEALAEATQLPALATQLCAADGRALRQAAQSLVARSDAVPVAREEHAAQLRVEPLRVALDKGHAALYPARFAAPAAAEAPDAIDVAPLLSSRPHRVSQHATGLALQGAGDSDGAATRLSGRSQRDAVRALALLQSGRLHRPRVAARADASRLRLRRPHEPRDRSQLDATRHTSDGSAATARLTAQLYGAHALPLRRADGATVFHGAARGEATGFQLRHDAAATPATGTDALLAAAAPPELLNAVATMARDKLQRLRVLATQAPPQAPKDAARADATDAEADAARDFDGDLRLCRAACDSSAAVAVACVFQEIAAAALRHWRERCGDSRALRFLDADDAAAGDDDDGGGGDERAATSAASLVPALRAQTTHALLTSQSLAACHPDSASGALCRGRLQSLRSDCVTKRAQRRAQSNFLARFLQRQHPLQLVGDEAARSGHSADGDRVYFESDRRFARLQRVSAALAGVGPATAAALAAPRGLRLLPVGQHRVFRRRFDDDTRLRLPEPTSFDAVRPSTTQATALVAEATATAAANDDDDDDSDVGDGPRRKRRRGAAPREFHRAFLVRILQTPLAPQLSGYSEPQTLGTADESDRKRRRA